MREVTPVKRVLILDDDPVVLRTLVDYLASPRVHLLLCSEIEAAECVLDRQSFDVLICDLEVSRLGGLEGFRLVRHALAHFPDLEVIVFSGKLDDEVRRLGRSLGATELLEKPAEMHRLRELLGGEVRSSQEGRPGRRVRGEVTRVERLEELLGNRSISALLQPIVRLDKTQESGGLYVEGLARGPLGSPLRNPELLLAYASKKDLLFETELQCISAVLGESRHLSGLRKLFINVHPRSLSAPGFASVLENLVRQNGYENSDVVLELTEQQSILNATAFAATLDDFRMRGFGLALDDYGSGFANLHLVQQLRPDYLKIDGFFCRGIENDENKRTIVEATVAMAHRLGISTIMECVETAAALEVLRDLGARFAQGYFFSEPIGGRELAAAFRPRLPELRDEQARSPSPSSTVVTPWTAGDIEHELSNLLTAIALTAAQGLKRLDTGDPLRKDLEAILSASEQAISLKWPEVGTLD